MLRELEIRIAKAEDRDDINKIFESRKSSWDKKFARRYYDDFFNQAHPNDEIFVGEVNNKVVSVIGLCPDKLETKDVYWLGWFYTHKDYAGKNIGGDLLRYVVDLMSGKARKLYVDTSSYRFYLPALNLYLKNGFRIEAVLRDYYEDGEDQIILGIDL